MLMSSKVSKPVILALENPRLFDIAPIFNLIQVGSRSGHFSNLYTQPRYMAGLGIQLFSLWANETIELPDSSSHHANMKVLRADSDFAGFTILLHEARRPAETEIYMCGVVNDFRGRGLGEWMLRAALLELPVGQTVFADCLPASLQMKSLLPKIGFDETHIRSTCEMPRAIQRYVHSGNQDGFVLKARQSDNLRAA